MENFVQELSSKKILSVEDIAVLKDYIAQKHKDCSCSKKTEILANAVHQILDNNLPEVNKEKRSEIRHSVLKSTILANGRPILLLDVFNTSISLQEKSGDLSESIVEWVNLHVNTKISKKDFKEYCNEISCNNNIDLEITDLSSDVIIEDNDRYKEEKLEIFPFNDFRSNTNRKGAKYIICFFIIMLLFAAYHYRMIPDNTKAHYNSRKMVAYTDPFKDKIFSRLFKMDFDISMKSGLPDKFKFRRINKKILKEFLLKRKSILAEEPYFTTIISVSKEYNLNPLLLFAITGQEQGFVTKESTFSKIIANNPFNVYHSWKEYNTDINDSCKIACITIINLCKDRPLEAEPFYWINRKYAEDKNWSKAVNTIFKSLEKYCYQE